MGSNTWNQFYILRGLVLVDCKQLDHRGELTSVFCPWPWECQALEILASTGVGNIRGWKTIFKCYEDSQPLDCAVSHLVPVNTALSHSPMNWPRLRCCSTFDSQWPKGQEVSILQLNCRNAGALRIHIFPQLWPMASYTSSLWSSDTGIQVPILLWMRCSLGTCFLTRLPSPTAV